MRNPALPVLLASATFAAAETETLHLEPLFNGEDLSGWSGEGYTVEDGVLVCTPEGGNFVSERSYANFIVDFEFRLSPGGNNGLGFHYPGEGAPDVTGLESQILDNSAEKWAQLQPHQRHGSLYALSPAREGHLLPVGEWNRERLLVLGNRVRVGLNGERILDVDLGELAQEFPGHEGLRRRSGKLVLCGHGDRVEFRNLQVAELPPPANIEGVRSAGFTQIFDGTTLDGWKAGAGSEGHWQAFNGILRYDGRSEAEVKDLWSEQSYRDFQLVFDWRWSGEGEPTERPILLPDGSESGHTATVDEHDSGIYLRGFPKAQVNLWNWPAGSGEVYGYRTDESQDPAVRAAVTPKSKADRPVGEWNRTMITLRDNELHVTLNGVEVVSGARLPGLPEEGPIGLQHHGSAIDFANLWIKEL